MCLFHCATPALTHQRWEPPNSKRSEPKCFDKTKHFAKDTLPWTEHQKSDRHGGGTSLPVLTNGPVDSFWTDFCATNATTLIYLLWGDRQNWPREKRGKNDGVILPCKNPNPFNLSIVRGDIIFVFGRADSYRRNDGVQGYHTFGTDSHHQTRTSESGDGKPPTSIHGPLSIFFRWAYCKQRRSYTTAGKGGYTLAVQNIYVILSPPPEEHHEGIENLNTIVQG